MKAREAMYWTVAAILLAALVFLSGCSIGQAVQLDADEKGAVCYGATGNSVNPFINAESEARAVEINTGDDSPVTPEQIAAIAEALGCNR